MHLRQAHLVVLDIRCFQPGSCTLVQAGPGQRQHRWCRVVIQHCLVLSVWDYRAGRLEPLLSRSLVSAIFCFSRLSTHAEWDAVVYMAFPPPKCVAVCHQAVVSVAVSLCMQCQAACPCVAMLPCMGVYTPCVGSHFRLLAQCVGPILRGSSQCMIQTHGHSASTARRPVARLSLPHGLSLWGVESRPALCRCMCTQLARCFCVCTCMHMVTHKVCAASDHHCCWSVCMS